jgi:hypothetical protein
LLTRSELFPGLHIPARAEWVEPFRSELLQFPHGAHDDCVDALSAFGMLLDRLVPGEAAVQKKEPRKLIVVGGPSTVCMDDLWEAEDRRRSKMSPTARIK